MWDVLSQSLREIHNKNASSLSFETLYRNAYRLVLKKHGEALYRKVKGLVAEHLQDVAVRDVKPLVPSVVVTGGAMFGNSAAIEKRLGGSRFLEQLKAVWEDHQLCMGMITDVLMYMVGFPVLLFCWWWCRVDMLKNRIFCADHKLPTTYAAGMGLFREHILRNPDYMIGDALNTVILSQIQMEREGDIISHGPIRSCIHMLESLYETEEEIESEKVYLTGFEPQFLAESAKFYTEEAQRLLRDCDAATYLKKTERRLKEEHDRCTDTISSLTETKILRTVEQHLIADNIREVMEMDSGIRFMLDNDRFDDINLLYKLITRVDKDKEVLKTMTCDRLVELGRGINAGLLSGGETVTADGDPSTSGAAAAKADKAANNATALAIKWVNEVLGLKDKYDRIWEQAMAQDKGIQTAMTRAFTSFINELSESPEYVSLFIDDNLRRGIKGQPDNEVELVLDKAITLFRYLSDKDVFERHYKNHLSRRLINNRTLSYDAEKQMIGKLKMEVGVAFTSKLEVMFKDMNVSEEMVKEFRDYRADHAPASPSPANIDLSVNVLNSVFWPNKVVGQNEHKSCIYPPQIESLRQQFQAYYDNRHNGRKLLWKGNMGNADLKATFSGKRHEIQVSTYSMVILLAFNDHPQLSYIDLLTLTQIPEEDLIRNLQSLAVAPKTRLLSKSPMSKDVQPTDLFRINDTFTSKFVRFRVGVVAGNKAENDKEKRETASVVEKDRAHQIEASIVRTMKQRKQLGHQDLVMEVIGQLKNRFAPDLTSLKKRIESLIERDYLERVEGSRETYRYLVSKHLLIPQFFPPSLCYVC